MGECIPSEDNPVSTIIPVKENLNKYWQIQVDGYKVENTTFNRKFDAIFSTTFPDIGVPFPVFIQISRKLNAKANKNGKYVIPCSQLDKANDVHLSVNGEWIHLNATNLTFKEAQDNTCYLRVRPVNGNTWILGTNFFYHYSTCFRPDLKAIQLDQNDNNFIDITDEDFFVNKDETKNGVRKIRKYIRL